MGYGLKNKRVQFSRRKLCGPGEMAILITWVCGIQGKDNENIFCILAARVRRKGHY
jgi:hypothetical protein